MASEIISMIIDAEAFGNEMIRVRFIPVLLEESLLQVLLWCFCWVILLKARNYLKNAIQKLRYIFLISLYYGR